MAILIKNIGTLLSLEGAVRKDGRKIQESDLGIQHKMALRIDGTKISWVGAQAKIPKVWAKEKSLRIVDAGGKLVLPGWVECHTHLIFAGSRAHEFEWKQQGLSYQQIAERGGGIRSTVREVRKISPANLLKISQQRVDQFLRQGVTTLEIKSGYGLNWETEKKILQVANKLKGPQIVPTYLGLHALAPEFSSYQEMVDQVCNKDLQRLKQSGLASRVDVFVDQGFFTVTQAKAYFEKAKLLGLEAVAHVEQLSWQGGARVACEADALSVDHVICLKDEEIRTLSSNPTTFVLLPVADQYLKLPYPRARELIDAGARVALATDFNPGTAPSQDLAWVGFLARSEMKMSLPEVIAAYTVGGASALGLATRIGSLQKDFSADLGIYAQEWTDLFYSVGSMNADQVFCNGRKISL